MNLPSFPILNPVSFVRVDNNKDACLAISLAYFGACALALITCSATGGIVSIRSRTGIASVFLRDLLVRHNAEGRESPI